MEKLGVDLGTGITDSRCGRGGYVVMRFGRAEAERGLRQAEGGADGIDRTDCYVVDNV
jgi:hypothetical protein